MVEKSYLGIGMGTNGMLRLKTGILGTGLLVKGMSNGV